MSESLQIVDFREYDLEDAARLVSTRYQALRRQEPLLPGRYENPGEFLPRLGELLESAPGVAALRSGRLVGFMAGYLLPQFLGAPAAYSPEWANAAQPEDGRRIYEELYACLSRTWVEKGCFTHALTLFASDQAGIQALEWLGFGRGSVDGIRELDSLDRNSGELEIRRAEAADHETVDLLLRALERHIAAAPVFWPHQLGSSLEWLGNPLNAMFLALQAGEVLGGLGIGPANQEACTIIRDEGTASIVSAYTLEDRRGSGVAAALLESALGWAKEQGYACCAVDFEAMNFLARRFWLKWFRPVCHSLVRSIIPQTLDFHP